MRYQPVIVAMLAALLLMLPACAPATPEPTPVVEATPLQATFTSAAVPVVEATQPAAPVASPTAVEFPVISQTSCTVVSMIPEPDPSIAALFPPITEDDWVKGPADAVVTILEYSDFQ
jgi:hypothetical protein